tara:strand:+ start:1466 stop:1855 length:390 start_codon:yes stop_codon:yes gene_type:complete
MDKHAEAIKINNLSSVYAKNQNRADEFGVHALHFSFAENNTVRVVFLGKSLTRVTVSEHLAIALRASFLTSGFTSIHESSPELVALDAAPAIVDFTTDDSGYSALLDLDQQDFDDQENVSWHQIPIHAR